MDILRNIEKKILNIANNNTNDVNGLKKDIKDYLDNLDKQQDINNKKKNKYEELYENKRKEALISYKNFLSVKADLMKDIEKDNTKGAIRKYLEYKYEVVDIPDIYTYNHISFENDNTDTFVKPKQVIAFKPTPPKEPRKLKPTPPVLLPTPPKEPRKLKPTPPKEPRKPKEVKAIPEEPPKVPKPPAKPKKLPKLPVVPTIDEFHEIVPEVPENIVIEPMDTNVPRTPNKLPKLPNTPKMPTDVVLNEPLKAPKKLPTLPKDNKDCKDDEEINPKTGKCVKKCKEGEIRNLETGRCNKIKEPKPLKAPKLPTVKK